jgi:uncharacterized YccA/Bax inhibitor family protein
MKKASWIPIPVLVILGVSHLLLAVFFALCAVFCFCGGSDGRPWGLGYLGVAVLFGTAAFGFIRAAVRRGSPGYVAWGAHLATILLIVVVVVWMFTRCTR